MPKSKKILLVTYYWPPAGGAGVQRWLKMVKYLAKEHQITILCPEGAAYAMLDASLKQEVPKNITLWKVPIWEPYAWAAKFNKKNQQYQKGQLDTPKSFTAKVSLWVRANLFIPDARMFWIKKAAQFALKKIKNSSFDVLISTGPPHSVHLIAKKIKQKHPQLHWLADFRDPWTQIDYIHQLPLTHWAMKKHQKLEKKVLQMADTVCTVSPSWAEDLAQLGNRPVNVVFNGFDTADFTQSSSPTPKFCITYVGALNQDRNPSLLWKCLEDKLSQNADWKAHFELKFIGNIDPKIKVEIQALPYLSKHTVWVDYLPHHEAIKALQASQVLLLLINQTANQKGIIPGKLFEYMAAHRTILCMGPHHSDVEKLLYKTQSGLLCSFDKPEEIAKGLEVLMEKYQKNELVLSADRGILDFSRENAAKQISEMINSL